MGDAVACASLMAGEGTGLAMTEAYVLAGELLRAGGAHRRAFTAYENRLRRFVTGKQAGAEKFIPFFTARTARGIRLRDLGIRAMRIPVLPRLLAARAFRDDVELPDYFA